MISSQMVGSLNVDNSKANFTFVKPNTKPKKYFTEYDKLDYSVPLTEEGIRKGHKEELPLSFFQIEEGDIESGKKWYINKFPQLPEEIADLLSRYNWGDLKYATKKSLRNDTKKYKKKNKGKLPPISIKINREPIILKFDF